MKKISCVILALLMVFTFASCGSKTKEYVIKDAALKPVDRPDDDNIVFYQIFVGSFSDSNGDGIGDLTGVINRLDYLNDGKPDSGKSLGIEGIWLSPIFTSPSYHKYDVADYYEIDKDFGTEDDLKKLIEECHKRGIRLILDLPINHTSSQHKWFTNFVATHKTNNTGNVFYDYYTWYRSGGERPSGGGYSRVEGTDDFYECSFSGDMPELNYDNPLVVDDVLKIAKYYIALGVDGFRFDASKYVYFGDNERSARFWDAFIGELRKENPKLYIVHEVWDNDSVTFEYNTSGNCFDFTAAQSEGKIAMAAKAGNASVYTSYVESYISKLASINPDAVYVPFLANHDMDRAAGFLPVFNGRAYVAANLMLLGPGSPFIYYGEELGMKGTRGGANTDANRRLAMVWGDGDSVKDPEGTTYDSSKQIEDGAMAQMGKEDSLYTYYKRLIMIRNANPEIARGDYRYISFAGTKAGGFVSTYEGSTVCVVHNTSNDDLVLDLSGAGTFTELRAYAGVGTASLDGNTLTISSQTSAVLK
ncbi:MAG: hypothetical protein IJM49_00100 [Firmicutes bacterium]|nr:hypothetical protein [Bacillota bacterium]